MKKYNNVFVPLEELELKNFFEFIFIITCILQSTGFYSILKSKLFITRLVLIYYPKHLTCREELKELNVLEMRGAGALTAFVRLESP